jgi:glycosyltransferase involved in cell wall biosynthesis
MTSSQADTSGIVVVIPAYNEAPALQGVLQGVKSAGFHTIIVVDDGSDDNTASAAETSGALVVRHALNRGKGAATRTGIAAALMTQATIVVTMDGDGQHEPRDIRRLLQALKDHDVALGTRTISSRDMPVLRRISNWIGNVATALVYGLYVHDSQSGFRAYRREAARIIQTKADHYEYESEVIREIRKHKLSFAEVPIVVLYSEYSKNKKSKQRIGNGFRMLFKMIFFD